jgi:hypothetical protein
VVDDILDVEESSASLGKTAGKDQAQQKATYPALYGIEKSRSIAAELEANALKELDCYGEPRVAVCGSSRSSSSRGDPLRFLEFARHANAAIVFSPRIHEIPKPGKNRASTC